MALGWKVPEHIAVSGSFHEKKHHILFGIYAIKYFELCYRRLGSYSTLE